MSSTFLAVSFLIYELFLPVHSRNKNGSLSQLQFYSGEDALLNYLLSSVFLLAMKNHLLLFCHLMLSLRKETFSRKRDQMDDEGFFV